MPKLVERKISLLTVCDYCRYRKCKWTESEPDDPSSRCYEAEFFEVSDEYIEKADFQLRGDTAKRIGSFAPREKVWYLNPKKEDPLTGYELKKVIEEEVNGWSEKNDLQLSEMVEYVAEGFERSRGKMMGDVDYRE